MSYLFVQDSGHIYSIPDNRTLVNLFDHEVFELYRVDNRSEGLVETPEDFKDLIEQGNEIGYEVGHILDFDLETLEDAVFTKKYGIPSNELSEYLKPWENGEIVCVIPDEDGVHKQEYKFSYSVDRWFPNIFGKFSNKEDVVIFNRIMGRNSEY